jgi:hypothetical protein
MRYPLIIALLFIYKISFSQQVNLFDEDHTMKFARYLYFSGQYNAAIDEFDRALFFNQKNDTAKYFLISSYIRASKFDEGIAVSNRLFGNEQFSNSTATILHSKLLVGKKSNELGLFAMRVKNDTLMRLIELQQAFQQAEWKKVQYMYAEYYSLNTALFEPFNNLVEQSKEIKHRSGFVAAAMSTLVPGSGKVYTGNWKDGVISLIMLSATSFQAYRGYSRKGFESTKFWIFGGLSAGFYFGNIYGSAKSAQKFNRKQNEALINKSRYIYMSLSSY